MTRIFSEAQENGSDAREFFPDYILVVDETWRWVIEAKPPAEEIGNKEIWQAYSYAKHHEVRAVMYCLCNGKELKIFRTDFAPGAALVKEFNYQAFETEFDNIANILSPDVIRKTWPNEATIFYYTATYTIPPARTGMLGMPRYPNPIPCSVTTTVRAYLEESIIKGDFDASMRLAIANQSIPVTIRGNYFPVPSFEI